MDRNGVDMQVLSLNSPGIQVQPDPDIAVADARTANDFLAGIIKQHPQRFAGLAALPLQDPPRAATELRRAVLQNQHRDHHHRSVLPRIIDRRDPGSWRRQGDVLDRLPL
jgi:predicted TIM-barrel fold metal-dependent hydrolase